MKRSKIQWILSAFLALVTVVTTVAGVIGYSMRSGEYVAEKLEEMRTYSVLHAAAIKIIDEIALEAKREAKDWATADDPETGEPNIKGRDNQREYYNRIEAEARAEAEARYASFEGMDLSPLTQAIPKVEAAEIDYYDVEAVEKAVYAQVYEKAVDMANASVEEWMAQRESSQLTLTDMTGERLEAAKATYAELTEEDMASVSAELSASAREIALALDMEAPAEEDGLEALSALAERALPVYEGMPETERAALTEKIDPALKELTRSLGVLCGTRWVSEDEAKAASEAFSEEAMGTAKEAYTQTYGSLSAEAEKGFSKVYKKLFLASLAKSQAADMDAAGEVVSEDVVEEQAEIEIDYSGFAGSEALDALSQNIDKEYDGLWAAVMTILPSLTEDMKGDQKEGIEAAIYAPGEGFEAKYERLAAANGVNALGDDDKTKMAVVSNANNLVLGAIACLVMTLVTFFCQILIKKLGLPRLIIGVFFIMLLLLSGLYGLNMSSMMSNVLKRTGQYGILVLAMLPGIQSGSSLNMGMTVGIVAGLLSTLVALEMNMTGWGAFAFAVAVGCVLAAPIGWAYAKLLNKLKGNEMTVSTYVGFSFVSLMSIFWMILPFKNPKLTWALGSGLRVMHTMSGNIGGLLNNFLSFRVFGVTVPTGLLLFLLLCCGILWLFSRSRTGTAMIAAGSNPRFAEAAGINVDKMRTIGTTLSTIVAAVGIIVYSQSFGFMQLYSGPRQMGFTAASAILIGGASTSRAKVSHVIIGTFLFQGVLSMGILVANQAISANGLSEVMRILISNGIILYALTQSGGEDNA